MASVGGGRRVGVRRRSRAPVVEEIVPNSGWTEDSAAHYLLVDLPGFKKEEVKLQIEGSERIVAKGERQVNEEKRLRFELAFPAPMNSVVDNMSGKFDGEILHVTVPKRVIQEEEERETEKASENVAETSKEESKHEEQSAKDDMKEESKHEEQSAKDDMKEETKHEEQSAKDDMKEETKHEEQSAKDDMKEETKHEEHAPVEERRTEGIRDQYEDESHRSKKANYIGSFPKELIRKWEQEPNIIKSAVEVLSKNKKIVITAVLAFSLGVWVSRRFQS